MYRAAALLGVCAALVLQGPRHPPRYLSTAPMAATGAGQEAVRGELKDRVELLRQTGRLEVRGEDIRLPTAVAELYESVSFRPLWTRAAGAGFRTAVAGLAGDGLRPRDYHAAALAVVSDSSAPALAELELLRTDALLLAAHDLRFGRAAPPEHEAGPTASVVDVTGIPAADLLATVGSASAVDALDGFRPGHFAYRGLVTALADLRRIADRGGWDPLPAGPAMRPDSADPRVPLLRRRLRISGDLAGGAGGAGRHDDVLDPVLEAAVRAFQHRHGLNEDGIVGEATRAELNVPVERRIEQVRVNLERGRWVLHDLPDTALVVNIAGAMVYLLHGTGTAFESRAIVGKPYTRTPVFSALLRYVELNPSWTVPPGIVGEILANVRSSPDYLAREGMRVVDRSGRRVDPSTLEFGAWSARTFPYVFRQDPGPVNALGRVKFGLPNPYNVYLHDTPSRELFAREQRTFSHGCVRVNDPVGLAEVLLAGTRWARSELEAGIRAGRTVVIDLPRPVPVIVQYWTAAADLHGEVHFHRDVYDRDPPVLERLERR